MAATTETQPLLVYGPGRFRKMIAMIALLAVVLGLRHLIRGEIIGWWAIAYGLLASLYVWWSRRVVQLAGC